MKKLLVILLLFFPVHGAWGEAFKISCISKEWNDAGNKTTYEIDSVKGIVKNENGIIMNDIFEIRDHRYIWDWNTDFILNVVKKLIDIGRKDLVFLAQEFRFSRTTGSLEQITTFMPGSGRAKAFRSYKCEKISGEYKF